MVAAANEGVLNALLYGIPSQTTVDYFRDKVNYLQGFATSAFGWAKNELENIFNRTYGQEVLSEARTVLREASSMLRDDIIHSVYFDNYTPNLITQSYIMEEPEVRKMYTKGLIDGFNGTYMDPEPDQDVTIFRENYAKVMNGMVKEVDNEFGTEMLLYPHLEEGGDLDFNDKIIVLQNWDVARALLNNDTDPTVIQ